MTDLIKLLEKLNGTTTALGALVVVDDPEMERKILDILAGEEEEDEVRDDLDNDYLIDDDEYELSDFEEEILNVLEDNESMSAGNIAQNLKVSVQKVVPALYNLYDAGMVEYETVLKTKMWYLV